MNPKREKTFSIVFQSLRFFWEYTQSSLTPLPLPPLQVCLAA